MIIGGSSIYKLFIPYADKLYLTEIDSASDADAYFPNFDESILNGIKLYCGKCPLDINEEIQYLKLKQYSVIKDIETEEEEIIFQK